jgi:hypothetical protein
MAEWKLVAICLGCAAGYGFVLLIVLGLCKAAAKADKMMRLR